MTAVPEALSPIEVGREAHRHNEEFRAESGPADGGGSESGSKETGHRGHRSVHIAEATLLAVVTIVTAWSGYAAAKWSTKSRVLLAEASTLRSHASREDLSAMTLR